MIKRIFFVSILTFVLNPSKAAEGTTAGEMLTYCKSQSEPENLYCLGYILGFVNGHYLGTDDLNEGSKKSFCLPSNWSAGQGQAVFVKWAEDNPDKWHMELRYTMAVSYMQAFPCRE
jgi:hypothetical protein